MDQYRDPQPPRIGTALDTVRAAIDVVAAGQATGITVQVPDVRPLLPAARRLAHRAGVRIELVEPADTASELTILPVAASGR